MTSPLQQKLKITGPVVITANRLSDGAVVYRTPEGHWTTELAQAIVTTSTSQATELLSSANADGLNAVGAYIAAVEFMPDRSVHPANLRERIRREGPTIAVPGAAER